MDLGRKSLSLCFDECLKPHQRRILSATGNIENTIFNDNILLVPAEVASKSFTSVSDI